MKKLSKLPDYCRRPVVLPTAPPFLNYIFVTDKGILLGPAILRIQETSDGWAFVSRVLLPKFDFQIQTVFLADNLNEQLIQSKQSTFVKKYERIQFGYSFKRAGMDRRVKKQ